MGGEELEFTKDLTEKLIRERRRYEEKANESAKTALSNNGITEEEFESAISYFNQSTFDQVY